MREYFIARAIVRCLQADQDRARRILSAIPLLPEITHFAAKMLHEEATEAPLRCLESFARSATTGLDAVYLGGNAITLLYASRGELPRCDWSGLRLDHAQLQGADLREARFVATSLRYANLDNANLEGADFTDADLEGVQLDETSQVLAVAPFGTNRIFAAYGDQSVREWHLQPGGTWESKVVAALDHVVERLHPTPNGHLVASGHSVFSVLDVNAEDLVLRSCFGMKSRFRTPILGTASALFAEELGGGTTRIFYYDLTAKCIRDYRDIEDNVICCALLDGKMYAIATEKSVHIIAYSHDGEPRQSVFADHGVSCLNLRAHPDGALVAVGHHDGTVSLTNATTTGSNDEITSVWSYRLHSSAVTTLVFGDSDQMITGSTDRTICVIPIASPQLSEEPHIQRLHLTLRCRNVQFAGVRSEREQEKLREYSTA